MGGPGDRWLAIPLVALAVAVVVINEVLVQTDGEIQQEPATVIDPWLIAFVFALGALVVVIGVVLGSGIAPTTFGGDRS